MKWFQVDSGAPNDPKIKALLRQGIAGNRAQSMAGAIFLLWCHIANHGKGEPGVGVRSDGSPLALDEMASECYFDSEADLVTFLEQAAFRGHVHPAIWQHQRLVFLPAMWERVSGYYRSKGRKVTFETAQAVADYILTGQRRAIVGTNQPTEALPDKQTRPDQTHQTDRIEGIGPDGPDLLGDAGMDQVTALAALWNAERKPGPYVREVTGKRRTRALAALKAIPNLADWKNVIQWMNREAWCNAPGTGQHPTWRADFDFLIGPGTLQRMLERALVKGGGRDARSGRTGTRPGKFEGLE